MMINQQPILQERVMSTDFDAALVSRIKPLMDDVDISTDCKPNMIGAINSVAASGGEPTEEAIKLLILKGRGEISMEEYLDLIQYFAQEKKD